MMEDLRDTLSNVIATSDSSTLNLSSVFSRNAFFHLWNIAKIRNILSQKDAETLVHVFVTSRLDYHNSLLSGCPNKAAKTLQLIQRAASRVLKRTNIREHISPPHI